MRKIKAERGRNRTVHRNDMERRKQELLNRIRKTKKQVLALLLLYDTVATIRKIRTPGDFQ